jgi:hypothetical protein
MKFLILALALTTISAHAKDCSVSLIHEEPNFNTAEIDSILTKKGYQRIESEDGVFSIVTTTEDNVILNLPRYTVTATATLSENSADGLIILNKKEVSKLAKANGGSLWRAYARSKQEAVKKIVKAMVNCK